MIDETQLNPAAKEKYEMLLRSLERCCNDYRTKETEKNDAMSIFNEELKKLKKERTNILDMINELFAEVPPMVKAMVEGEE